MNQNNRNNSNQNNNFYRNNRKDLSEIKFVSTNIAKKDENDTKGNINDKKNKGDIFKFFNNKRDDRNFIKNRNRKEENRKRFDGSKNIKNIINTNKDRNDKKILNKKNRPKIDIYKISTLKYQRCIKCSRMITEMGSAIKDENDRFIHFDCVIRELSEKNKNMLKPGQKISYLGSNIFGIVEEYKENGKSKFKIKEKITYVKKTVV